MHSITVVMLLIIICLAWLFLGFLSWRRQRYGIFHAWLVVSFWGAVISLSCGESIWCMAVRLCS